MRATDGALMQLSPNVIMWDGSASFLARVSAHLPKTTVELRNGWNVESSNELPNSLKGWILLPNCDDTSFVVVPKERGFGMGHLWHTL